MAAGAVLKLKFGTASGEKTFSYRYGNSDALVADVRALMDGMITNGSIFKYPPLTRVSATMEVTSVTEYNLNG